MNPVEKLLRQGLESDPADWSVRLELAEKLAQRSAGDEFDQLLREAPVAPTEDAQAHRIVELANDCERWDGLKQVLALFAATQPNSPWARFTYARTLLHTGDAATALVHYKQARNLDDSLSDPDLDTLLAEKSAPVEPEPEVVVVETEPEAAPLAVAAEPAPVPVTAAPPIQEATPVVPAARPLRPPSEDDAADTLSPLEETGPSEEVLPAAPIKVLPDSGPVATVPPTADESGDKAEIDHDHEGPHGLAGEHVEHVDADGQDRAFIVGDGEMVHAHEKDSDAKQKVSAITVAILVHVALILLLGLIGLAMPRPKPPQITANAVANVDDNALEQQEIKKIKRAPVQTAAAQMQVTTVTAASQVSLPDLTTNLTTFDPIGAGDNFGTSMSFDMGEDGGMVSFFGAKSISKKVVFVVDYSASMGGAKDKLMRKELAKSIEALPNGVQYQLILFSGPAWYAGQKTSKSAKYKDGHVAHIVKDGREEFVWYEGWDKDKRHGGNGRSALYHYSEGDKIGDLPKGEYITATRTKIRKTLEHVKETPLSFGTDWRWPLMMAIAMEPDTIYFMTDGAFGTGKGVSKKDMIDDLLSLNRRGSKAKINTICMMVLQARNELEQLAEGSRGEFTLVLEDGTVVRGKELDKFGKKK